MQIESGSSALVPVGTTGESPTLTHEEHETVIEEVVKAAAGRELRVMLPMITDVGEIEQARSIINREVQHLSRFGHGLPTRLLDWTYSPYIALHFATANHEKFDIDGVIWVVNFEKDHRLLPAELRAWLDEEGAQAFTVELLSSIRFDPKNCPVHEESAFHDVIRSLYEFDSLRSIKDFLLFFEPPSMDERIVNQFSLFSVMPNPEQAIDDWLFNQKDLYGRVIIPSQFKWEIRDKLDQCNITERVLFPAGPTEIRG